MAESSRALAGSPRAHGRLWMAVATTTVLLACTLAPTIVTQPQSQTVVVGQAVTFSVVAKGRAPLTYQWTRNGAQIPGATSPSYTAPAATLADSGAVFQVVVSNRVGTLTASAVSAPATLTVLAAPAVATQPQSQTVIDGQTATFSVTATGSEPLAYQWSRDGADIAGATSASYTTAAVSTADSGAVFRVTVSNAAGSVQSDAAALTVVRASFVYRDGVVGEGWAPQAWGCGTTNMSASFAGSTAALFDLTCGGWIAGTFGHWSSTFDLGQYDTLSFDVGSDFDVAGGVLSVWFENGQSKAIADGLVAGRWSHVTVALKDVGLAGGGLQQFGFFNATGATPGPAFYVNNVTFVGTPPPTTPPTVSNLAAAGVQDYSATLTWATDRACTGTVTYQASGGPALSRPEGAPGLAHTLTLDSLEPSTTYAVTVVATDLYGNVSAPAAVTFTTAAADQAPSVTVTLDPAHPAPISPYIYGINGLAGNAGAPPHLTLDRFGGNRLTAYNWENNASNAGSDWQYSSDGYLSSSAVPGEAVRSFIDADRAQGLASIVTLQMQGWVSADEAGAVDMTQPLDARLAARFKQVVFKKSTVDATPFTVQPSTSDPYVFMDEEAWALDQKFAGLGIFGSQTATPTFVCLDNEPELWNATHAEIQGTTPEATDDYIQRTIALSSALKDQFPEMQIFGPVHYGFGGLWNFQNDSSLGGDTWFTDKYLQAMKAAEAASGRRLLDVYDFHWYSESQGPGGRVTGLSGANLSDTDVQAVVQSPRSLWDPTFTDSTDWISRDVLHGPIRILGRLQEKIDASYPGTKIAVTEYENGGWNHIAGTIAQADDLGIFASHGVYAATFWPPGGTYDYALAGFRAFRGFDGAGAVFGDVSIPATSSDVSKVMVYASQDSAVPGRLVFVAINRSAATQKVAIQGQALSGTASLYRMTSASAAGQVAAGQHVAPILVGQVPVSGTSMLVVLPGLSVTTIAVQ